MTSSKPRSSPPEAAPATPAAVAASPPDVALVHRVTPDGTLHVIRRRGDQLEAGALSPLREGAPIQGEVLSLRPRENFPLLCDVEVLYKPPAAKPTDKPAPRAQRKGPAQVATDDYRDNWDSIWATKKSDALN